MRKINYTQSGVNISKAEHWVLRIKKMTRKHVLKNKKIISAVGGYAALYQKGQNQLLALTTDGVGTKLKLACETGIHNTIGVDLVAMNVNDLLCVGARPTLFLDYYATSKLEPAMSAQILSGMIRGCEESECFLVGGETAEMPGIYQKGEYDLAGFAIGELSKDEVLPKKNIKTGDILIGLPSSGFHSNGYSLVRRLIPLDRSHLKRHDLLKKLLTPTRIYVQSVLPLIEGSLIKACAHMTGSGFLNLFRLHRNFGAEIHMPNLKKRAWSFNWVSQFNLDMHTLYTSFNMGVGMVLVVDPYKLKAVVRTLNKFNEKYFILGEVNMNRKIKIFDSDKKNIVLKPV